MLVFLCSKQPVMEVDVRPIVRVLHDAALETLQGTENRAGADALADWTLDARLAVYKECESTHYLG